jgi:hypothetical protein
MERIMAKYIYNCRGKKPRMLKEVEGDISGKKIVIVEKRNTCRYENGSRCNLNGGECWLDSLFNGKKFVLEKCNGVKPRDFKYLYGKRKIDGVVIGIKLDSKCSDKKPGRRCNLNEEEECWLTRNSVAISDPELDGEIDDGDQSEDPFNRNAVVATEE